MVPGSAEIRHYGFVTEDRSPINLSVATDMTVFAYQCTADSRFGPYPYIGPQDGVANGGTFLDAAIFADDGERIYMSSRFDGCLQSSRLP